ncbi:hypothetical protein B0H11DRAFT_1700081 [Mycena galericulata]|nr:hypothetical protein B0H11DRAFT_1700081 [Mycena galericulata]
MRWETWSDFQNWIAEEQRSRAIELRLVNTYQGLPEFERQLRYVCSRGGTGGIKTYLKSHPEWNRKIETKRTDCKCRLLVKQYPGISTVLGDYRDEHDHKLGNANLRFTQIPKETREHIAALLRLKLEPDHILRLIHQGVYDNDDLFERDLDSDFVAARTEFIQLRDIRRIQKEIQAESVRLDPDDGISTLRWVERLRARGYLLDFKSKTDPPPPGSGLASDVFTLMFQTDWQRKQFARYGESLLCIDATHNVTMYENLDLTSLLVRDNWGHGTHTISACVRRVYPDMREQESPWHGCWRQVDRSLQSSIFSS